MDATADEIEKLGAKTLRRNSNVHDRSSLEGLCGDVLNAFGRVDVLMVTSGLLIKIPTLDMGDDDWSRVIDANLNGSFRANQIFGRHMIAQKSGSIINTCSMTTFVTFNEVTAYAASKSGVGMLTKQLACEWCAAQRARQRDRARRVSHAAEHQGAGYSGPRRGDSGPHAHESLRTCG